MFKFDRKVMTLTAVFSALVLSGCASNDELIEQQQQQQAELSSLKADMQAQKEVSQKLSRQVEQLAGNQNQIYQHMRQESTIYQIKENDTLYRIAERYDMTVDELLQLNPEIKNPKALLIGQNIKLK